ncbi:MAG: NYN domain-containing protein [Candidatus Heimdallarchaeota archaeon]|nr:NYN domain-containing protein [Candidatus Heimdallarchaeota archaeon]
MAQGELIENIPLLKAPQFLFLLLQEPVLKEKSNINLDEFTNKYREKHELWAIGVVSWKKPLSYNLIFSKNYVTLYSISTSKLQKQIKLNEITQYSLKRGRLLFTPIKFLKVELFTLSRNSICFYIVTNNISHFNIAEDKIPRLIHEAKNSAIETKLLEHTENIDIEHNSTDEIEVDNTNTQDIIEIQTSELYFSNKLDSENEGCILLWDIENVNVPAASPFQQDEISQKLWQVINQFKPFKGGLCTFSFSLTPELRSKIDIIDPMIKTVMVTRGKDNAELELINEAEKLIVDNNPQYVIVVSSDGKLREIERICRKYKIYVLVIHKSKLNSIWKKNETVIDLINIKNYKIIEDYFFKCRRAKCNFRFKTKNNLDQHIINDHNIKCGNCKNEFKTHKSLVNHQMKSHNLITCISCLEIFQSLEEFFKHRKKSHTGMICTHCRNVLESFQEYDIHLQQTHQKFVCRICLKELTSENGRNNHEKSANHGKLSNSLVNVEISK